MVTSPGIRPYPRIPVHFLTIGGVSVGMILQRKALGYALQDSQRIVAYLDLYLVNRIRGTG